MQKLPGSAWGYHQPQSCDRSWLRYRVQRVSSSSPAAGSVPAHGSWPVAKGLGSQAVQQLSLCLSMALQSWRSRSVPLLLAIIFFLIWTPCGTCDTEIASNIEVPTTFRLAQSPYNLAAGVVVTVFAQASLTIQAGVTVKSNHMLSMNDDENHAFDPMAGAFRTWKPFKSSGCALSRRFSK